MIVIFDIDGVLADCKHRLHFQREKNYDEFYSDGNILKDTLIEGGVNLLASFGAEYIYFLTGRPWRTYEATKKWLWDNLGIIVEKGHNIFMRKNHDYRPSDIVKVEIMEKFMSSGKGTIFIDDDPKNVKAMEKAFPGLVGLIFGTERLVENFKDTKSQN